MECAHPGVARTMHITVAPCVRAVGCRPRSGLLEFQRPSLAIVEFLNTAYVSVSRLNLDLPNTTLQHHLPFLEQPIPPQE